MSISFAYSENQKEIVDYYGDPLPIYSMTKTFIAALIFAVKIDIDSKISTWISKSECKHNEKIKVLHLLNHSSGLKDYGNIPEYIDAVKQREIPWSDDKFISLTTNQDLLFTPGQSFSYSNPGYWLLKTIIERQSNNSFETLINEYIKIPQQLESLSVLTEEVHSSIPNYKSGWVWHGLLLANARDVVKFFRSEMVSQLRINAIRVNYSDKYWKNPSYAMGLMTEDAIFGHMGGGPGFEAACFTNSKTNKACCAIVSTEEHKVPIEMVFDKITK